MRSKIAYTLTRTSLVELPSSILSKRCYHSNSSWKNSFRKNKSVDTKNSTTTSTITSIFAVTIAATIVVAISSPCLLDSHANTEANCDNSQMEEEGEEQEVSAVPCNLSWVTETASTKAECGVHESRLENIHIHMHRSKKQSNSNVTNSVTQKTESPFYPAKSKYFSIRLSSTTEPHSTNNDAATLVHRSDPILHNSIVVLPNLMSLEECKLIVQDAERILDENKRKNIKGCKTESWTIYSRFNAQSQQIMDRVLGKDVISFLQLRMPTIANKILKHDNCNNENNKNKCITSRRTSTSTSTSTKELMSFYWDDPVVIKYVEGNKLAPHEDMRELTVVIPLNPLDDFPLGGESGGTRFWLGGTTPENADSTGGVSVKPSAGSGILFNGEITHSGNPVYSDTRFVLMSSITLDDDVHDADDDDDDELEEG